MKLRHRGVSRSVRALASCVVVLGAVSLAAAVEPARACSCIPPDPWSYLERADGAFVGRLVSRREADRGRAVLTFSVERAVKGRIGQTVEVTTANNGAACGIETSVGQRIGLFLMREGDGWVGHLCWQVAPEDLLAAAALPAPNGKGPVALFVRGRFGPARLIALDAKGNTLSYGMGAGRVVESSVCPGGRRVAELVGLERQTSMSYVVAVRELPTLRLIREQRLRNRYFDTSALRCANPGGEQIIVFRGSGPDLERRARLLRITPAKTTTIWQGMAWYATMTKRVAYTQVFDRDGTTIVAVNLRTGRATNLGTVPVFGAYELAANPAGTRLAGDAFEEGCRASPCAHLLVVDLERRPISLRTIPLPTEFGPHLWLRNDRFAYFAGGEVLIFTPSLRISTRFSGWHASSTARVGSTLVGIGRYGRLLRAKLPAGPVRVIRRLPGRPDVIVSATS